jgi:hypothetical protein
MMPCLPAAAIVRSPHRRPDQVQLDTASARRPAIPGCNRAWMARHPAPGRSVIRLLAHTNEQSCRHPPSSGQVVTRNGVMRCRLQPGGGFPLQFLDEWTVLTYRMCGNSTAHRCQTAYYEGQFTETVPRRSVRCPPHHRRLGGATVVHLMAGMNITVIG